VHSSSKKTYRARGTPLMLNEPSLAQLAYARAALPTLSGFVFINRAIYAAQDFSVNFAPFFFVYFRCRDPLRRLCFASLFLPPNLPDVWVAFLPPCRSAAPLGTAVRPPPFSVVLAICPCEFLARLSASLHHSFALRLILPRFVLPIGAKREKLQRFPFSR